MLSDITLGQFIPGNSLIHNLDPRIKIISVIIYIVTVFVANSVLSYVFLALFTFLIIFLSEINLSTVLKSIKPVAFLILFTAVINLFLTGGNDIAFEAGIFRITYTGIKTAAMMAARLIFLVVSTAMLTYTTSPIMLTDGIEKLLSPLKIIKFPSHELAMMMTIALRFIPTLLEETDKIIKAQKARGADFESGNLIKRVKSLIPILVPLFINSFRRADDLALAMECRCYRGGEGRTRLKQLSIYVTDIVVLAIMILLLPFIIVLNLL